jgi:hypothetical protein
LGYTFKSQKKDYESELLRALLDIQSVEVPLEETFPRSSIDALQLEINFKKNHQYFPINLANNEKMLNKLHNWKIPEKTKK